MMPAQNRNIESYVKYYELFTTEECSKTVEQLNYLNWEQHKFYVAKTDNLYSHPNELFISNDEFEMKPIITLKLWGAIKNYILDDYKEFSWFTSWNGYSSPRFNKYPVGTEMVLHCDHIQSLFDGQRKGVPILTVLGALNDGYEGGELVMWQDTVINLKAGSVMVFPSNFMYPHEVKLVTKGTRYSFVSWVW
jgi:predicted 2-oxoglutarate/Fe(II)-dependent dioxygenase YbiX